MRRWWPVSGLPAWLGYVSAFTEFLGGLLILVGFFTRAAAFAVFIDLFVAIWKVHCTTDSSDRPIARDMSWPWLLPPSPSRLIFFGGGPIAIDHVLRGGGRGASLRS